MRYLALTAATLLLAAPLLRAEDRLAPPDSFAQAKAEKTIKDLFKDDFAKKKATDLQDLAGKLIKQAGDTADDPAGKFVLYRLAIDAAARAGDAGLVLQGVEAQSKDFAVDAAAIKAAALDTTVRSTSGLVDYQAVLDAALAAADEAQGADNYDTAGRLLRTAQTAAGKLKDTKTATMASERGKLVDAIQKEFDNAKADLETLKTKPDDPNASQHVGRFLCFFKGDWDRGLPLLAQGTDANLKSLAKKDINVPTAAADQAALADAWMDAADAEKDAKAQMQIQLHAYSWYKQASPQLTGLDKAKVDKRIKDLDKVAEKLTVVKDPADTGWFVLFRSPDPRIWDTDFNMGKNAFAVPLDKAPDGVQYLKLTWPAGGRSVIIPMTNDALKKHSDDGTVGWQGETGESRLSWKGYHLGVYDARLGDAPKGQVCVIDLGNNRVASGWGFGHRAYLNDLQGYTWAGVPIAPTVFEIAVKAGPLTDAEAKKLLGKKDK